MKRFETMRNAMLILSISAAIMWFIVMVISPFVESIDTRHPICIDYYEAVEDNHKLAMGSTNSVADMNLPQPPPIECKRSLY